MHKHSLLRRLSFRDKLALLLAAGHLLSVGMAFSAVQAQVVPAPGGGGGSITSDPTPSSAGAVSSFDFGRGGGATSSEAAGTAKPGRNMVRPRRNGIILIEPIERGSPLLERVDPNDANSAMQLPTSPGIKVVFDYFNMAWPWLLGVAAGFAVLQALVGGIQIMLSGGDSGKREAGQTRLLWALAGMLLVGLSGFILRTLNPLFYQ